MLGLNFTPPRSSKSKIMSTADTKKVLAVLDDLFFTVKINEAAKRAGLSIKFVKSQRDALDQAAEGPALIILDLNFSAIQPVELIQKFKADPSLQKINLVGYVSHVQGELKQEAQEAGCDMVLARSAFSQSLQQIMKRHAN
jgi:CheY-like chemotaxis protein